MIAIVIIIIDVGEVLEKYLLIVKQQLLTIQYLVIVIHSPRYF